MLTEPSPGLRILPLRTPTLFPATHTNCFILGSKTLTIVDPGSPYPDEQARLEAVLLSLEKQGHQIQKIVLTHQHPDHVGGVKALVSKRKLEVWAHPEAAWQMPPEIHIDHHLKEGDEVEEGFTVLHTPGHTQGHIALWHEESASLICGDLMAEKGSILINPPDGDMRQYFESLHRVKCLSLSVIYPAHGAPILSPETHIQTYLNHRIEREEQVLKALADGVEEPMEMVKVIYDDIPSMFHALAERSLRAHLKKLLEEHRVMQTHCDRWFLSNTEGSKEA